MTFEPPSPADAPEFLVAGNVTRDLIPGGWKLGGAASYATLVAARLGLRTALLTRACAELDLGALLPGVEVERLPAGQTTVFEHFYRPEGRIQYVRARAGSIGPADIPRRLRTARTVLLGPVIDDVEPAVATVFPAALLGATAQGWLRRLAPNGLVQEGFAGGLDCAALRGRLTALFLSEEDLAGEPLPAAWPAAVPVLVVTRGEHGANIYAEGQRWEMPVFPAQEIDPTGAGDAFAAGFLIRYAETADLARSARFAAAVAAFVIESSGIGGAPDRASVDRRLREHPEVRLIPAL